MRADPPRSHAPRDDSLALYVHWPFCVSKCPYCDFNSHVRDAVDQQRWGAALLRELETAAAELPGRSLSSIFFGGGTPSLMAPETAARLIERAKQLWPAQGAPEITLEANPGTVDADRFRAFREAGIERLSIGVQSLEDAALRFLGRAHDAATARRAVGLARATFPRVSFDLIYALPDQSVADWRRQLADALAFQPDHLSVYQLTVEPGTAFHTLWQRGELPVPDEETAADLYEATQDRLEQAGLPAYEISNHARRGAESRHNLVYWRYGDYAGIGPGAHGRLTLGDGRKVATRRHRAPEVWLERVERGGHGETPREALTPEIRWQEALMMGLRLAEGVPLARLANEAGRPAEERLDRASLDRLIDGGFLVLDDGRLRATAAGRQRLNAVIEALVQ